MDSVRVNGSKEESNSPSSAAAAWASPPSTLAWTALAKARPVVTVPCRVTVLSVATIGVPIVSIGTAFATRNGAEIALAVKASVGLLGLSLAVTRT